MTVISVACRVCHHGWEVVGAVPEKCPDCGSDLAVTGQYQSVPLVGTRSYLG